MHLGQGGWSAETEEEVPETGSDGPQPRQIDSPRSTARQESTICRSLRVCAGRDALVCRSQTTPQLLDANKRA